MGNQTELAKQKANEKGWNLRVLEAENWKLWMRKPVRSDWLVVGAHGGSIHKARVNIPNMYAPMIYFLTQKGKAAPGLPDSWYVNRAVKGGRWEEKREDIDDAGQVDALNTAAGELPFEYTLTKYSEDAHVKTVTDMYEGGAEREFDAITVSKNGTSLGEILGWLSANPKFQYPHIVAGFCNTHLCNPDPPGKALPMPVQNAPLSPVLRRKPLPVKPQPILAEDTKPSPVLRRKPLPVSPKGY